ncbi:MAG: ABC transporter permease [Rhodobacteraceae bacterium]|nr:ABC transporter permease [Paracoccaceae bacterium]
MGTSRYIVQRLAYGLVLMLGVVVLNFFLIHAAPGDAAEVIAGEMGGITEEMMAQIRAHYGLDQPLLVQLWIYLKQVAVLDLGQSYHFNRPVTELILQRLGPTILLAVSAQVMAMLIGVVLGVLSSRRPQGVLSGFVSVFSTVGYAAPVFWTGLMLVILFSVWVPLFPVEGWVSARFRGTGLAYALNVGWHLVLPATTLGILFLAQYARLSRTAMIEVLGADYIRTARAKGLGEGKVTFRHALRNAVLPILTIAGLQFGNLISGALLVETVFNWPGMGRLAFDSVLRRDYPTLLGVLFCASAVVVLANLLTDLSYRIADPRIRTGGR